MFIRLLLSLFVCFTAKQCFAENVNSRIMGGNLTEITKVPYIVSLQYLDPPMFACGGTILSRNIVLTAAHCATMNKLFNDTVRATAQIRAGTHLSNSGGILIPVKKMIYPDYGWDNDLCILVLLRNLVYSLTIQKIPLATTERAAGTMALVSGWGFLNNYLRETVDELRSVSVPTVDWDECKKVDWSIKKNILCAGYKTGGFDSCNGDSGGPLAEGGQLIGVVSGGTGCGLVNHYGLYLNVVIERDWILQMSANYTVDKIL